MTRDELVERVARELCLSDGGDPNQDVIAGQAASFENYGERWQAEERSGGQLGGRNYVSDARIALAEVFKAVQEPTEAMYVNAHKHYEGEAYLPHGLWQAMLSASPLAPEGGEE